jgi:hypothetical protein
MCEKCVELDKRIVDLQRLAFSVDNQRMRDATNDKIADIQAQKIALHPEKQGRL